MGGGFLQAGDRGGQLVGGRYRLVRMIGAGGQSIVYEALDERAGDAVAVKVLNENLASDPNYRERMFREARAMAALTGTAAVRVLDQQWTDDHALCLVMELLHGEELEDHLLALEARGERMSGERLLGILEPVAFTVNAAHQQGIIHRDLKPGNIFLVDAAHGGGVRVLDFGFAKFERMRGFTAAGVIAGSPTYIAPEAWRGMRIDHRVDIYALGAIAFRALGGRPPFEADELSELLKLATTAERPSLRALRPDLPPAIDDWVRQALAANPDDRFLRMPAMFSALRAVLTP